MRKLIMWNVISLDGCFEGEKPWDLDFHNLVWGKELEDFGNEQLASADMLVFGKNTYEGMATYWQTAKGETAQHMNRIKKVVCSQTLDKAAWNNTMIVRDAIAEISKLKKTGDGDIFVFGSGKLSAALIKAGLFDEFRLVVAPVFLGKGKRLFNEDLIYQKLNLIDAIPLTSGGVILQYTKVD